MAAPKGNQNAKAKGRKRIDVHISLAGERLVNFEKYIQKIMLVDRPPTDTELAAMARDLAYEWFDTMVDRLEDY